MTRNLQMLLAGPFLFSAVALAKADGFPAGPAQALVQTACIPCHQPEEITAQHKTAGQWADTVNQMVSVGAKISDDDYNQIVDYLVHNFGPQNPSPNPSK